MHNLFLIIKREYVERVARKSFLITTLLMPIIMIALMAAPTLVMLLSKPESKIIAVIDPTDMVGNKLRSDDNITFVSIDNNISFDSVRTSSDYDAILVLGSNVIDDPNNVSIYSHSASSMQTEEYIASKLSQIIQDIRVANVEKDYNIENLPEILDQVKARVSIQSYRLDKQEDKATSSTVSYIIGLMMAMMLYMFIMIYGNMVMNSIIEEKNNRVLEIIVSSVRPKVLMLGKILGIGLVAFTQILIWGFIICLFSAVGMPILAKGVTPEDADLAAAMTQIGDVKTVALYFVYILLFLIGGFLMYSSIYAAIGSAVDNVQDASQLSSLAVVPIILGFIFSMVGATDPNSTVAVWVSIIPLTSPMAMMSRIPFGIPFWQIALSLVLLYATFLLFVWLAAKIYRVGIFMYGKRPSIKDLIRWAKYK